MPSSEPPVRLPGREPPTIANYLERTSGRGSGGTGFFPDAAERPVARLAAYFWWSDIEAERKGIMDGSRRPSWCGLECSTRSSTFFSSRPRE